ncbi:MAG: hypothetical protein LPJ98_15985, partial [Cyclobacteriaceae bacterium]|nr:hypothetical protein [Cyclobacteriaceae bacterium]
MVYDLQDRLVAWRDARLAAANKWIYTKYDALGRVVLTGIVTYTSSPDRNSLQSHVNTLGNNNAVLNSTSGRSGSINAGGFPQVGQGNGEGEVLSANFYDTYALSTPSMTYIQRSGFDVQSSKTHGLLTGKLVTNLSTGNRVETVYYYDSQGREIQTIEDHHLGGQMRFSTRYDFNHKILQNITEFTSSFGNNTVYKYFNYDVAGLLVSITHQANSTPTVTIANFSYDQLGNLTNKTFPVAGNAAMNYTYNIRGWLKSINNPQVSNSVDKIFAQELFYESGGTSPQFNGNISKAE